MFDIAPTELLLVALIALVVIGPKDLPRAMRFVGKWIGKARGMARHFRSGLDTMMREAELEELEKQWRQQNEAIMREYPRVDEPVPADPDAARGDDGDEILMRPTAATPDAPTAPPKGSPLP
jgi:sec-independent protein translocase protein TatB